MDEQRLTEQFDGAFVIRFEPASAVEDSVSPLAVHLENVRCHPSNGGFRIETKTTNGTIDLLSAVATVRGPRAMYPIDNLLRHLLPILWNRGVLGFMPEKLHADPSLTRAWSEGEAMTAAEAVAYALSAG